jgi:hypothetical protein
MTTDRAPGRAIEACRRAGVAIVEPAHCICSLHGRLIVLASAHRLEVIWPYDRPCPIHDDQQHERPVRSVRSRPGRPGSRATRAGWAARKAGAR